MSDPAVEAAERAWEARYGDLCAWGDPAADIVRLRKLATAGAGEALAPIRAEIENLRALYDGSADGDAVIQLVVNRIAQHVYPSEEL